MPAQADVSKLITKRSRRLTRALLSSGCILMPLTITPAAAQTVCNFIPGYDASSFPETQKAAKSDILTLANCTFKEVFVGFDVEAARGGDGANKFIGDSGDGGAGAKGKAIVISNSSNISHQFSTTGIQAISIGGNGGTGGSTTTFGSGGNGGAGGNGGFIVVANAGQIDDGSAFRSNSPAIIAISQGGKGGAGGNGGWLSGGGDGGLPGNSGDKIIVFNSGSIDTSGPRNNGITAQSIGGVGGEGGTAAGGLLAIGGNGAAGGQGEAVTIINSGSIETTQDDSKPISARSIGGGGGEGGDAFAFGLFGGVALGGYGGGGGAGGDVTVNHNGGTISSQGFRSTGIKAQSIGGGGGDGGSAGSVSVGTGLSFALAIGGSGGNGGAAGDLNVNLASGAKLVTGYDWLNPGMNDGPDAVLSTEFPGSLVGENSLGVLAQSVGGGGGHGGSALTVAAGINPEFSLSVSTALGGRGGNGGKGGLVNVTSAGTITTAGNHATGIVAQSIGGGGGIGGSVTGVQASVSDISGSIGFNLAGAGGSGNNSDNVTVSAGGSINTLGNNAAAVIGQSVAGGGGAGGNSFNSGTAIGTNSVTIGVSMGGSGGTGGQAGQVALTHSGGNIATYGNQSAGFVGQAIGGGGGHGGSVQNYTVTVQGGKGRAANANVGLGGSGGNAGMGGGVSANVNANSSLATFGDLSAGMHLQSIGGGGGVGGNVFSFDASVSISPSENPRANEGQNLSANVSLGGSGGTGGNGNSVNLNWNSGNYSTAGLRSSGAILQSIGGGGGAGGHAHSFSINTSIPTSPDEFKNRAAAAFSLLTGEEFQFKSNLNVSVDIGGKGAKGGDGGAVNASLNGGTINTQGNQSHGLVAQSVGGGGGMGGNSVADGFAGIGTYNVNVALGGSGGNGGVGGRVDVVQAANSGGQTQITTAGDHAHGVVAQSIGGGGGEAGSTHVSYKSLPLLSKTTVNFGLGGSGGSGGTGGAVSVGGVNAVTAGAGAHAVVSQSIGGGGGIGGASKGAGLTNLSLGGNGGSGNHGGTVTVGNANATTKGTAAIGILAQSIGGGGGNVGVATGGLLTDPANTIKNAIKVSGSAGNGGDVTIGCTISSPACGVSVVTGGATAIGILAQSIGGGGGAAQITDISKGPFSFELETSAPADGNSGTVYVKGNNGNQLNVTTQGNGAIGLLAQSFDKGGGSLAFDASWTTITTSIGNTPASTNGGIVFDFFGNINTNGDHAHGALLQSLTGAYSAHTPLGTTVFGGTTVNSGKVIALVENNQNISTSGATAHGLYVQTNSTAAAKYTAGNWNTPTLAPATRAQTIVVAGNITTNGADAYGVYATNGLKNLNVPADQVTTSVLLAPSGVININNSAGGGIYVKDYGNAVVEVQGRIQGTPGSRAVSLQATHAELVIPRSGDQNGVIYGDVMVSGMGPGSTATVSGAGGNLLGTLTVLGNGGTGSIKINRVGPDTQYFPPNLTLMPQGQRSIVVDAGVTSITAGNAWGDVVDLTKNPDRKKPISLSLGGSTGGIYGNFDLSWGGAAFVSLGIDPASGKVDAINVTRMAQGGPSANGTGFIDLIMTSLPTQKWTPQTLITVAEGMAPGTAQSVFAIAPQSPVVQYDIEVSTPAGGPATAVIKDISIDFTRATSGSNYGAVAQLANQQVQAYMNGTATPDTSSQMYNFLLSGIQAEGTSYVQQELRQLEPSLHYSTAASASSASQQNFSSQQSCGGAATATVDPISQGECSWAKYSRHNSRRDSVQHAYASDSLMMGRQWEVGGNLYLGLSGSYASVQGSSPVASSNGHRMGLGAIVKYVQGDSFGSVALIGSYDWVKGARSVSSGTLNQPLTARMKQEVGILGGQLRLGRRLLRAPVDIIARADFDALLVHDFGYTEQGAGAFNLHVAPKSSFLFNINPMLQISKQLKWGNSAFRLYGEVGPKWLLNDIKSRVALAQGFNSSFSTDIRHHREETLVTYGFGAISELSEKLELRINYNIADGRDFYSDEFGIKLALKF